MLTDAGIDPEVVVSGVDETVDRPGDLDAVAVIAERKAMAVARIRPGALVLGCDSLLDMDGSRSASPRRPRSEGDVVAVKGSYGHLYTGHCLTDGSGRNTARVGCTAMRFGNPTE